MRGNNLYSHFKLQFESRLDSELLCTASGESFTYRDADSQSSRLASYLVSLGLQPGDRVSVQAAKSPNALFLYLACLRGGFVYHPLNPAYTDEELDFFLSDATPQVVVCDPARRAAIGSLCQAGGIRHLFTLDEQGQGTLVEKLGEDTGSVVACDGDDIAALLYSSGTTGVPKGIMLSHDNLLQNARSLVDAWGFRAEDRLLHALPIFHVHGLFVALGCVLLSGASMRWLDRFDAERVAEFLPECSVMMGVPTYYTRLLG